MGQLNLLRFSIKTGFMWSSLQAITRVYQWHRTSPLICGNININNHICSVWIRNEIKEVQLSEINRSQKEADRCLQWSLILRLTMTGRRLNRIWRGCGPHHETRHSLLFRQEVRSHRHFVCVCLCYSLCHSSLVLLPVLLLGIGFFNVLTWVWLKFSLSNLPPARRDSKGI